MEEHGVLSEENAAFVIRSLCDILHKLHGNLPPIIHRDIKPSNIIFSSDGVVKLIDFNAARELRAEQNEDTRLMGTRRFAAPEQYGFGQSDPRTDIYALGITFYYMLTGDYPTAANMPASTMISSPNAYNLPKKIVIRQWMNCGKSFRNVERSPDRINGRIICIANWLPNVN